MKRWIFKLMALTAFVMAFASCKEDEEKVVPAPTVELTSGETTTATVSFTVVPANAVKCSWYCEEKTENSVLLSAREIFSKGTALEEVKTQVVSVADLKADTEYVISAAVENEVGEQATVKELLTVRTEAEQPATGMKVEISDITTTASTITFTVTSKNAGNSYYTWEEVDEDMPDYDAYDVASKGTQLDSNNKTVTIDGLKDNTKYMLFAACEAADSYDKVMTKVEVTTKPLDAPSETIEMRFSDVAMKLYRGNNYVLTFTNNEYTVKLDMWSDEDGKSKPFIPAHEYKYEKDGTLKDWSIATLSEIIPSGSGNDISLEKGSVKVEYSSGTYTITGSLISEENKEYKMTFNGEIPYIIETSSSITAEVVRQDNGFDIELPVIYDTQKLKFHIDGQSIAGEFTEGSGIETTLALSQNAEYEMQSGSVKITLVNAENSYYNITGNLVTKNGDIITLELTENITIKETEEPGGATNITFTEAEAVGADTGGWIYEYGLTLSNDDWELYVVFNDLGELDELPASNILISPEENSVVLTNKKTGTEYRNSSFNSGEINITKSGDTYSVEMNADIDGLGTVKTTYQGPIVCESWGESWGNVK